MPRLLDTDHRVGTLTAAVEHLLGTGGVPAVTMRAIARESGVSTSSMHHHLDTRERLLRVCAHESTKMQMARVTEAVIDTGPVGLLPEPEDHRGLWATRVWLGWFELWRSTPTLGDGLLAARAAERRLLARALDHRVVGTDVLRLHSLVEGLRAGLCQPAQDLAIDEARACLARHLSIACGTEVVAGAPLVDRGVWGWPYVPGPRVVAGGRD